MGNAVKKIKIRQMYWGDCYKANFAETLSALKLTTLDEHQLRAIYKKRISKVKTFVAVEYVKGESPKIVGTVSLLLEQKFINNGGICGHIEDMAVHEDYQRQGIGRSLVEFAVKYAREKGAYKVILDCADDKIPFYLGCGFSIWQNSMRIDL